jgi:hypothetical protein
MHQEKAARSVCVTYLLGNAAGLDTEKARGCNYLAGVGAYPCRQVTGVRDVVGSAWHVWQLASAILFPRSKGGCRHARLQYRIIDTPNSSEPAGLQGTAALWRIQNGVVLGDAIRQFAYLHPDGGGQAGACVSAGSCGYWQRPCCSIVPPGA